MSLFSAVVEILTEAGAPLHYREITKRILERGLWETQGKTPEATVNARLAVDIKKRGSNSRFQRTAEGVFALRSWRLPEFIPKAGAARASKKMAAAPVKTLSFTDAAEQVLERYGDKKPMHYRAITEKALEIGLLRTEGLTPHATLYAQILTEIERKARRGGAPRFVKYGKGMVGLTKWIPKGIIFQIDQQNSVVRKKLHARLHTMTPTEFEELIGELLVKIGFEDVVVTGRSGEALLALLVYTGLRVGEAVNLLVNDVILGERSGKVIVRMGKGKKYREVPLHKEARKALAAYMQVRPKGVGDHVFIGQRGALGERSVQVRMAALGKKAEVKVTPHVLRHTFGTRLLREAKADLVTVSALMGHSSVATTAIYTQPSEADLVEAVEGLK